MLGTQFSSDLGCCSHSNCVIHVYIQLRDYRVSGLCPCVCLLTCEYVNASMISVEHWMCEES